MATRLPLVLAAASFLIAAPARSQEHPEHPKNEHPNAHAAGEVTISQLAAGIREYIDHDSKIKGGFFLVYDSVDRKPLQLSLVKVHDDKLASLGNGVYFACTDLKNNDGVIYDLDFFMKQGEHGLEATEVSIHKKAGKPRYGWKEENGIWKKVAP